jgi:hypothetical protein
MSPEQAAIAAALRPEDVAKIDSALLSHARRQSRKVSMIVALTMADSSIAVPGLPDVFYAERVGTLVAAGKLIAIGNLSHMRYSEVRLSEPS